MMIIVCILFCERFLFISAPLHWLGGDILNFCHKQKTRPSEWSIAGALKWYIFIVQKLALHKWGRILPAVQG